MSSSTKTLLVSLIISCSIITLIFAYIYLYARLYPLYKSPLEIDSKVDEGVIPYFGKMSLLIYFVVVGFFITLTIKIGLGLEEGVTLKLLTSYLFGPILILALYVMFNLSNNFWKRGPLPQNYLLPLQMKFYIWAHTHRRGTMNPETSSMREIKNTFISGYKIYFYPFAIKDYSLYLKIIIQTDKETYITRIEKVNIGIKTKSEEGVILYPKSEKIISFPGFENFDLAFNVNLSKLQEEYSIKSLIVSTHDIKYQDSYEWIEAGTIEPEYKLYFRVIDNKHFILLKDDKQIEYWRAELFTHLNL